MRRSGHASLAIFYCDSEEDQKSGLRGLLSSVLFQLCDQSKLYYDILLHLYVTHRHGAQDPSDDALVRCLMDILKCRGQGPVFLVIDGLDECSDTSAIPSPRRSILLLLEELISSYFPNLHICITSRPEVDIQAVLQPWTFHSVSLDDEAGQMGDIIDYVRSIVDTDPEMRGWNSEDKQLIIDVLTERADGV